MKQQDAAQEKPLTLDECGDVLTVAEFCRVLRMSQSQFFTWKRHGVLPVQPMKLPGDSIRFSKHAVRQFLLTNKPAGPTPWGTARRKT